MKKINIGLTIEQMNKLIEIKKIKGLSYSDICRRAIDDYFIKIEKSEKKKLN